MSAPNTPTSEAQATRLRLRMSPVPGSHPLDGGWWPRTRNLTVELADLVDHFPADRTRILRASFSPPDWDDAPRRVPVSRGYVQVGFDPNDDTHVLMLRTADRQELCLLVVPPEMSPEQGEAALEAATTKGYAPSPGALLDLVRERVPDTREPEPEED